LAFTFFKGKSVVKNEGQPTIKGSSQGETEVGKRGEPLKKEESSGENDRLKSENKPWTGWGRPKVNIKTGAREGLPTRRGHGGNLQSECCRSFRNGRRGRSKKQDGKLRNEKKEHAVLVRTNLMKRETSGSRNKFPLDRSPERTRRGGGKGCGTVTDEVSDWVGGEAVEKTNELRVKGGEGARGRQGGNMGVGGGDHGTGSRGRLAEKKKTGKGVERRRGADGNGSSRGLGKDGGQRLKCGGSRGPRGSAWGPKT